MFVEGYNKRMKFDTVHDTSTGSARRLTLPRIGFGTWKIGGESTPNPKLDSVSMTASSFRVGSRLSTPATL